MRRRNLLSYRRGVRRRGLGRLLCGQRLLDRILTLDRLLRWDRVLRLDRLLDRILTLDRLLRCDGVLRLDRLLDRILTLDRLLRCDGVLRLDRLLGGGGLIVLGAFDGILEAAQSLADRGSGLWQPARADDDQHYHENDYEMGWSQSPHNGFSLPPSSRGPRCLTPGSG
jgi:hypothetical protein